MEKNKQNKLFEKCLKNVDPYILGYTSGVMDVLKRIPTEKEIFEESIILGTTFDIKANVATAMANWIIKKMTIEQNPETCTKYEPTYVQSLLDEIEELKTELEKFKKIDEEKVDKLAKKSWNNLQKFASAQHVTDGWNNYVYGFKSGYRKAKEE